MYYRINISQNGYHYFATADHSITDERKAKEVMKDFKKRFPSKDGFAITCTLWQTVGHSQFFNEA